MERLACYYDRFIFTSTLRVRRLWLANTHHMLGLRKTTSFLGFISLGGQYARPTKEGVRVKFLSNSIRQSYNKGKQEIILTPTTGQQIDELQAIISNGKLLEIDLHQQKKKRSLDANSYAWVLITKIADALRTSKEELYIEMLKRYGQREKQLISIIDNEEAIAMIYRATNNHCTVVGEGTVNGKQFKHLAILIGSSQYDTRQMAILIDGIVSECKEMGIETLPPDEIKALKESWK